MRIYCNIKHYTYKVTHLLNCENHDLFFRRDPLRGPVEKKNKATGIKRKRSVNIPSSMLIFSWDMVIHQAKVGLGR